MRKTKEILRLHHEARRSGCEIARTLGMSPATVQECLRRARITRVDLTAARDLNDTVLEGRLYPPPGHLRSTTDRCRTSPSCTPSSNAKA